MLPGRPGLRPQLKARQSALAAAVLGAVALFAVHADVASTDDGGPTPSGTRYPVQVHRGASLPPPAQAKPVPLLIGLHARGGTPLGFEQTSGLDAVADRYGFVTAYLSSPTPTVPAWTRAQLPENLAYISAEIKRLVAEQHIDPNRVYVTGFSAGASMAFQVGCNLSGQVAGIAPVSGAMRFADPPCRIKRPVSELLVIGTNDAMPLAGNDRLLSGDAVAATWRRLNGCGAQGATSTSGPVTSTVWGSCTDESGVGLSVIAGGTHQWPGAAQATGADAQYAAAQAVWQFFAAHPGSNATAPSATVTSVGARRTGGKRWLRVAVRTREPSVVLRAAVTLRGRAVAGKRATVPRPASAALLVTLPPKSPGGRYSVRVTLSDAYGRTTTVTRGVAVPRGR